MEEEHWIPRPFLHEVDLGAKYVDEARFKWIVWRDFFTGQNMVGSHLRKLEREGRVTESDTDAQWELV